MAIRVSFSPNQMAAMGTPKKVNSIQDLERLQEQDHRKVIVEKGQQDEANPGARGE
jgi:hypothetical protein